MTVTDTRTERYSDLPTPEADAIVGRWASTLAEVLERLVDGTTTGIGLATLICGVLILAATVLAVVRQRPGSVLITGAAIAATLATAIVLSSPGLLIDDAAATRVNLAATSPTGVDVGLWLTLAGAVLALLAGAAGVARNSGGPAVASEARDPAGITPPPHAS